MRKQSLGIFIVLAVLAGLVFSCAVKPRYPWRAASQFKDPELIHGSLPNGFQYVLMENQTPSDRVNIHLNVFTGSAAETGQERGLAHYLEHMLFNGSEHFKPGELITYFQSIGMDFGADANARTSFFNTVYDLNLPKGDQGHLEDAFVVIRDYAQGALLLESEIDRERGVILAEKRERDSVSFRTFKKELAFELPGSVLAQRLPIGTKETIEAADRALLKGFYDRYYRPDNMALVIVGDMDARRTESMIRDVFSSLEARSTETPAIPDMSWQPHEGDNYFYHGEPEAGATQIVIERIVPRAFTPETTQELKQKTTQYLGDLMFQNRLSRMVREQTADFSSAMVYSGSYLRYLDISAVQASCDPENWERALRQTDDALRQAIKYGFSAGELDRVTSEVLASLDADVEKSDTRKSSAIAQELLSVMNRGELFLSPAQRRDLLSPHIKALTLDEVNQTFRGTWPDDHRLVMVTGNLDLGSNGEHEIARVFTTDRVAVQPYTPAAVRPFPYLALPGERVSAVRDEADVKGLGIRQIDLANNIRVNLKPTPFKKGEISFKAVFGRGRSGMPIRLRGLGSLVESAVGQSGLGAMAVDELDIALAGRNVDIRFSIDEIYFALEGRAAPDEAELVFQLIYAYMNDPGFRDKGLALAKIHYRQQYDAFRRTPDGVMTIYGNRFLAGGDDRFGLKPPETADQLSIRDIENWLRPEFESGPMEISVVGDFDESKMAEIAETYLGAMTRRLPPANTIDGQDEIRFPKGESKTFFLDTQLDKALVRVSFLTDDFWDITQTRQLSILARVFSERLRKRVREALGASYSPYVYNNPSLGIEGYGVMSAVVTAAPQSVAPIQKEIQVMISDLLENGVTEEELALVKSPLLNHLEVLRQTNGYWLNSVMADSFRRPERLDWALNLVSGYNSIQPDDLTRLAKTYLIGKDKAVITILPDSKD